MLRLDTSDGLSNVVPFPIGCSTENFTFPALFTIRCKDNFMSWKKNDLILFTAIFSFLEVDESTICLMRQKGRLKVGFIEPSHGVEIIAVLA